MVGAIQRGIQATQEGRPVLLEMITKEEPIYPANLYADRAPFTHASSASR